MNHTGNLITIGVFDRKNLATISTSDDAFSQHLSLLFEKVLQDVTNLALAIMDFTTDSCQIFTSKILYESSFINSLEIALQMWEIMKFLKPIGQVVQTHISKIIIEVFQFTTGKNDTFEKEKFLDVEISTHLQTLTGCSNVFGA